MEIDTLWEAFPVFRQEPEPVKNSCQGYLCRVCGGRKSFDVWDDLPVCIECGIQDDEFISDEPEWRSGIDESGQVSDPARVGAPVNTDHFSEAWGIGTLIRNSGRGKSISRLHFKTSMFDHRDRALWHAYNGFDTIGKTVLNLPECVMYSAKIKYKKFVENVLTRGAVRNGVKANCIFQACRENGVSRTTREIADAFGIPQRDISRTFDMFQDQNPETEVHVTMPADIIPRFFNSVTCVPDQEKGRVRCKVINACKKLEDNVELMGRTPKAVACAVMFVIIVNLGYKITKPEICRICDVSGPTLSKIENIVRNEVLKQDTTS